MLGYIVADDGSGTATGGSPEERNRSPARAPQRLSGSGGRTTAGGQAFALAAFAAALAACLLALTFTRDSGSTMSATDR